MNRPESWGFSKRPYMGTAVFDGFEAVSSSLRIGRTIGAGSGDRALLPKREPYGPS